MLFDEVTVKSMIRETFVLVANLGLISHFVHTAYASLPPGDAVNYYKAFRRLIS